MASTSSLPTPNPISPKPNKLRARDHLLSGALSGFASSIFLQPLDLIKTRIQQGPPKAGPPVEIRDVLKTVAPNLKLGKGVGLAEGEGEGVLAAKALKKLGKSREILPVVREVISEEGVRGLWRGTVPTIARNVPGVAFYFYFLTSTRTYLSQISSFSIPSSSPSSSPPPYPSPTNPSFPVPVPIAPSNSTINSPKEGGKEREKSTALPKLNLQGNLLAGAMARTVVGFVLNPFTVLKSRYESNLFPTYTSLPKALISLTRTSGIRGLLQGFPATALRDAPYAGISVVVYEESKDLLSFLASPKTMGSWNVPFSVVHGLSGSLAAGVATLMTSPADCVKTKMQVMPESNPTIRAAMKAIYEDRGVKGFFSGSSLRITRKAASAAIAWSIYEGMLLFIRDRAL